MTNKRSLEDRSTSASKKESSKKAAMAEAIFISQEIKSKETKPTDGAIRNSAKADKTKKTIPSD